MKLVLCVIGFVLAASVQAQDDYYDDLGYQDLQDDTIDELVKAEIQEFRHENEEQSDEDVFDDLADYQIEDNRSVGDKGDAHSEEKQEPMPDDAPEMNLDDLAIQPVKNDDTAADDADDEFWNDLFEDGDDASLSESDEKKETENDPDEGIFEDVVEADDIKPLPVPEKPQEMSVEIQKEDTEVKENSDEKSLDKVSAESAEVAIDQLELDKIIEETGKLLEESDDDFKADYDYALVSDEDEKSEEDVFSENNDDDETPEQVLSDLDADLDKLFETLDKLTDSDSAAAESNEKDESANDVQDYEEKYNRPYKENNILQLREEMEDNLSEIFSENAKDDVSDEDDDDQSVESDAVVNDNQTGSTKATAENAEADLKAYDDFDYSEEMKKLFDLDDEEIDKADEIMDKILKHSYGEDGLVDKDQPKNDDAEVFLTTANTEGLEAAAVPSTTTEAVPELQPEVAATTEDIEAKSDTTTKVESTTNIEPSTTQVPVETTSEPELSNVKYDQIMRDFRASHSDDLEVQSDANTPIPITLSVDKPTVITSPNYPNAFPANTKVDWILEGPGTGIEFNVTHLALNGVRDSYLLVKPGGVDASGTDGLVFSFTLRSERRYRFTNVNRLFMRFDSGSGLFMNGFGVVVSARMLWPLPEIDEDMPEPEPVLRHPEETLTLSLAGLTLAQFEDIRPVFKELIADMAEEYIVDNNINRGLNTTLEVTQITRVSVCNIRWPNYETCVGVTFGVPLHYEEEPEEARLSSEELADMWRNYITEERFSSRLSEMGITEYAIPNDRTILMVWMVIAGGVLISMALLAFALWRFSCFEDYTRMQAFNDGDSVQNEKRKLDLYPTPHQSLPPLYSDNDYKWADDKYDDSTRVDLGGFANKSYVRDDLFEFDSDEDVMPARDRSTTNV
ncbi:uncharacterized protein LOC142983257 isoform X2 [Anticarsia gemmatalis]|uniref:uncharacterized protein LOC142983257 isoform X2 n=1 Tax=Anticarsia gemmatalis TaxID=129554 RepID=UPI003F76E98D